MMVRFEPLVFLMVVLLVRETSMSTIPLCARLP